MEAARPNVFLSSTPLLPLLLLVCVSVRVFHARRYVCIIDPTLLQPVCVWEWVCLGRLCIYVNNSGQRQRASSRISQLGVFLGLFSCSDVSILHTATVDLLLYLFIKTEAENKQPLPSDWLSWDAVFLTTDKPRNRLRRSSWVFFLWQECHFACFHLLIPLLCSPVNTHISRSGRAVRVWSLSGLMHKRSTWEKRVSLRSHTLLRLLHSLLNA